MRRHVGAAICFILLIVTTGLAQTRQTASFLDNSGDFLELQTGTTFNVPTGTVVPFIFRGGGTPFSVLTLVHSGGTTQSVTYAANMDLLGAGNAFFAVVTVPGTSTTPATQTLIAIVAGLGLPGSSTSTVTFTPSMFPNFPLTPGSTVQLGPNNTLSIFTAGTPAIGNAAAISPTVTVVQFSISTGGEGAFTKLSVATLPQ